MTGLVVVALVWSGSALAFVGGAFFGRCVGQRQALRAAAAEAGDEACRAVLHGRDQEAGRFFALSQRLRDLEDPPAPAGDNRSTHQETA